MVRLSAPNTPRDSWRGWPACGGTSVARHRRPEDSDRELIAHVTLPRRPVRGGSDVATGWNPTGEGSASVPGPAHGSLARPVAGRARRDSGRARFAPDGTTRHH